MHKGFLEAGHLPTMFASFLYFLSLMVWVLLGPFAVAVRRRTTWSQLYGAARV